MKKKLKTLSFKKQVITKLTQSQVQGGRLVLKTGETENWCSRDCSRGAIC